MKKQLILGLLAAMPLAAAAETENGWSGTGEFGLVMSRGNADTDTLGGPLAYEKQTRRRADLTAMVKDIRARHPDARAIRGRSWLYNLEAYRRLFPADYAASAKPETGVVNLHGNSSWGQMIDSREAVRPEFRATLLANLAVIDPEAPWRAFPLQVLRVTAPIASFETFYDL